MICTLTLDLCKDERLLISWAANEAVFDWTNRDSRHPWSFQVVLSFVPRASHMQMSCRTDRWNSRYASARFVLTIQLFCEYFNANSHRHPKTQYQQFNIIFLREHQEHAVSVSFNRGSKQVHTKVWLYKETRKLKESNYSIEQLIIVSNSKAASISTPGVLVG